MDSPGIEPSTDTAATDVEMNMAQSGYLANDSVESFSWHDLQVKVKDRTTKAPLSILTDSAGIVQAGEMVAIMGPSGSGKTTLLNALAHRVAAAGATTTGDIQANGQKLSLQLIRDLSSYVEQEDALIGSLTVRETMIFAARLALPRYFSLPPLANSSQRIFNSHQVLCPRKKRFRESTI